MAAVSLVLLLAGMILGALTLWRSHRRQRPVVSLGYPHALIAVAALLVLGVRVATGPENLLLNSAFLVFLLAALGGVFTLAVRRRDEPVILPLILLHASAGVVAFLLLAAGILAGGKPRDRLASTPCRR